ncbi:hypothetical protein [Bacillus thuringiensis]|uniref:hypothetical protein n=1 Tax=Bacillus cereus group TaxID=86661 RepID=UPI00330A77EE|nr:hypothetical protein [Bacillus cereus]MCU5270877.1 hypothetical protein [Bacillus cereus]MCU5348436.1 hypothetical protein [Bacillus cereus]MCU5606895.1 hypothetical protein [Bacillus cereus]MCU5759044.1 hypothetical protein [Bacillus cereus]
MKKKLITFALLAGIGVSAMGGTPSLAKSAPTHNCGDSDLDLRFKTGNRFDHTDPRPKLTKSYIYMKTNRITSGGVKVWAQSGTNDASGGRSEWIYGPGVTLIYNLVYEKFNRWYHFETGPDANIYGEKNAPSQVLGDWSPDYC